VTDFLDEKRREITDRLKELKPDLKVMLTSGHIDRSIERRQKQYGIDSFVPKPYNPQELVRRVRAALDRP